MKHLLPFFYILFLPLLLSACVLREKNQQYGTGDPVLQGSYWMLLSLPGQELQDNPDTHTAYIRFEEGSDELKGYTGCNRLSGRYRLRNGSLQLSNLSTTRAMCPIIEQENFMMAMLEQVDGYEIAGDVLTLFHQKKAVATFRAGIEPVMPDEQ